MAREGIGLASAALYGQRLLDSALALPRDALHLRRLEVEGLRIEAWFSDPDYADICQRNLTHRGPGDHPSDLSLFLLDTRSLGWAPVARWADAVHDRAAFSRVLGEAGLRGALLVDPRVWQFYRPERRVGVQLIEAPGAIPPWEAGGPLRAFLHWGAIGRGDRLVHAGSLGWRGRGVLLGGASGSGKSGTTLAGVVAGLATVGDDFCLASRSGGVFAYPLYSFLKQDEAGVARVLGPDFGARLGALDWQNKHLIHARALERAGFVDRLQIEAIVIPQVTRAGRSTIRSISAAQAMRAFAPSSVFLLPDDEARGVAFAADLCRDMPCFQLLLSDDPNEIAQTLSDFLKGMPR
jgi:hypothetical protein